MLRIADELAHPTCGLEYACLMLFRFQTRGVDGRAVVGDAATNNRARISLQTSSYHVHVTIDAGPIGKMDRASHDLNVASDGCVFMYENVASERIHVLLDMAEDVDVAASSDNVSNAFTLFDPNIAAERGAVLARVVTRFLGRDRLGGDENAVVILAGHVVGVRKNHGKDGGGGLIPNAETQGPVPEIGSDDAPSRGVREKVEGLPWGDLVGIERDERIVSIPLSLQTYGGRS